MKKPCLRPEDITVLLITAVLAVSCSEEEGFLSIGTDLENQITLDCIQGAETSIVFSCSGEWVAASDTDWISIWPSQGGSGTNEITICTTSGNYTGETRTAAVTLMSAASSEKIYLQQDAAYIHTDDDSISASADGEEITINFTTNMTDDMFSVYSDVFWITQREVPFTKTESIYSMNLTVLPNYNTESRTAVLVFEAGSNPMNRARLADVTVTQDGTAPDYESSDYSQDKTVRKLHSAAKGNGIPMVLMGDGFTDLEIEEGYYDQVMDKAFENLFTEEPVRSLIDYFNVYAVTAVSANDEIGRAYDTAFSCILAGGGSTGISGDDDAVKEYASCVEGIDLENTLAIVILDTEDYAGTTYFRYYNESGQVTEFAIAYCPVIYDLENEAFRQVLSHEAIGHGFAKLGDEYSYDGYGQIPQREILEIQEMQDLGWMRNIDFTPDSTSVLWSSFLYDSEYKGQGLGVYEGADSYQFGAYRPSEDSMMNSNQSGFNAPSRQAIYDQVMKLGEGRTATYEEFAEFDHSTQTKQSTRTAAMSSKHNKRFHRPQFADKPL